jgi:hypothetical protein
VRTRTGAEGGDANCENRQEWREIIYYYLCLYPLPSTITSQRRLLFILARSLARPSVSSQRRRSTSASRTNSLV